MDQQALKLLEEKQDSVAIDRDIVEGILTEMHSEIESLTLLATMKSDVPHDSAALLSDLELKFNNIMNLLSDLSYCSNDTLESVNGKLNRIEVHLFYFSSLLSICL